MQQVTILCPLYNDEASFNIFAAEIEKKTSTIPDHRFSFAVINDGSSETPLLKTRLPITLIHLHRNLGHQKAIAIGLSYIQQHLQFDKVLIMDADGEDKPEDISLLLSATSHQNIVAAGQRASRQEGSRFKFFYYIYKMLFHLFTGTKISFGNFMLLPKTAVEKLIHHSEIWNNLPGGLLKSKIPLLLVPVHRGKRYEGKSKMHFNALLLHGLGAIGVFIEVVALRLFLFSLGMIFISIITIIVVILIKYFTYKAIPGWATTAISSMLVILLQSFLLSLFTVFLYLSFQGQRKFIPAHHYMDYVRSVENGTHE